MSARFTGRVAAVTGAAGGMGWAIAEALVAEGARVTLLDVKPEPERLDALGENAQYLRGDLSEPGFVAEAFARCHERWGRLDGLVNAAGVLWFGRDRSLLDIDLEVWDRVLEINLKSVVLTVRHAVPLMRRIGGGAMVHVATTQCLRGDDHPQDAYQASKAAIIALSRSVAIQCAPDGIRSNVLLPHATETPMQARWEADPELRERTARSIPLGRVGRAQDMAQAALFLLGEQASFITGTELAVDGGYLARP